MENTHKRRNISQLHQLTEVGACFDGKYFEIQQRLAARVATRQAGAPLLHAAPAGQQKQSWR